MKKEKHLNPFVGLLIIILLWRDANVVARVEGRRAFIESRFEPDGVGYIDIDAEFANNYWQGQSK